MTPALVLLAAAAVGTLLFALAPLLNRGAPHRRVRRRLDKIARPRSPEAAAVDAAAISARRIVADSSIASLDRLIKRLLPRPAKMRERLAATGRKISLAEYLLSSLLTGGVVFTGLNSFMHLSLPVTLLVTVAIVIFLPYKVVGMMIARRRSKFLALFPEAIELMVRGLKSGIPASESMKVVGRELPAPVGEEFRGITDALTLGQPFDEAIAFASKRIGLAEFRFFEISLGIQQETGGNLAETLENLATILRKRKQMKIKIKALSSEARASAYILGALPFLIFIVLLFISPDQMMMLFNDRRGNIILGAAAGSLSTGVAVMIKMGKLQV